ncbi:hypothetical protein JXC34_06615 [Candidatus Woesearchaeota archaeon]|nr:hypothetical protein [Candidatus Woesearchaeota archaeon]
MIAITKEYIRFLKPVPFLYIDKGDEFRVYYDKECRRFIKHEGLRIDVDKRKGTGYMELITSRS